jgi:hypothetical protein
VKQFYSFSKPCTSATYRLMRPPRPRPAGGRCGPPGSAFCIAPSALGLRIVSSMERIKLTRQGGGGGGDQAASTAAEMALILTSDGSHTNFSNVSQMPSLSTSTPNHLPPVACFCRSLFKMSVESNPQLSASCRGITSSASPRQRTSPPPLTFANALMMSCDLP